MSTLEGRVIWCIKIEPRNDFFEFVRSEPNVLVFFDVAVVFGEGFEKFAVGCSPGARLLDGGWACSDGIDVAAAPEVNVGSVKYEGAVRGEVEGFPSRFPVVVATDAVLVKDGLHFFLVAKV